MREKRNRWLAAAVLLILSFAVVVIILQSQGSGTAAVPREDNTRAETVEAHIVGVLPPEGSSPVEQLELEIDTGPRRGEQTLVEQDTSTIPDDRVPYRVGDRVVAAILPHPEGTPEVVVEDYARSGALAALGALFIGLTIVVSGWKGVRSLVGLAISFVVLWFFVLPRLLTGQEPVSLSIAGSCALLAITLYLTQGWSIKTHAALLGVLSSLLLTGFFASFAVNLAHLSGTGTEEAVMVHAAQTVINLRGLLLAGVLVGALGALYDMAVSQASTVMELADANPTLRTRELYRRAMNIGQDHIAATINTLVLAYVGTAIPILLLYQLNAQPWIVMVNREFIGEEILRTLIGSLGLIAAVPITTLIACILHQWQTHRATQPEPAPQAAAE